MSSIDRDSNRIRVDYFNGAYGPTIRIDVQSRPKLERMKEFFLAAAALVEQLNLSAIEGVVLSGLHELLIECTSSIEERTKSLVLERNADGRIVFRWSMRSEGWKRCAGLVDGLLMHNAPGHQYLTQEKIDDALVELAFMENRR